jgi:ribosomal-protein-alanine N-acetyltransferase
MNADIDLSKAHLQTERLELRPFVLSDLDDFYAYASVPDVGEWAGWSHHKNKEESLKILEHFIAEKKTFALVDKATKRVIGSLGIEEYHCTLPAKYENLRGREIGYVLSKAYWGKGLMTEAVKAVIAYCFNDLHLDFLTIAHFTRNKRSERVILKCGFSYVGNDIYETRYGTKEDDRYYVLDNPNR